MAPVANVVEDGVDERPGSQSRPGWLLVAVGFLLGLILGTLIVFSPEAPSPPETAPVEAEFGAPEDPGESPPVDDGGISAVVSGFPDALVGVSQGRGSGYDHHLWPVRGPLISRTMTGGQDVRFDAGGRFLALTEMVPGLDGRVLSMGRVGSIRAVVSGVTSFAWHDSDSGLLSFTTEEDGEWAIFTVAANLNPLPVVGGELSGGTVVAWGDWGFAVQRQNEVSLLTSDGEFRGMAEGRVLASHANGWLLVSDNGLKLVSSGGGVRRLEIADELDAHRSAFSPDGDRVAVAGASGVVVIELDTLEETRFEPTLRSSWVSWSSDSRFVVAPARTGVLIHDTETGDSQVVLAGTRIVAAATIPLSGT